MESLFRIVVRLVVGRRARSARIRARSLATSRTTAAWSRREWVETGVFVIGTAATTQVVFGRVFAPNIGQHPFEYVIFCLVIVAAVRLGQPTTALVVLAASAVTVWNTVHGAGPFAGPVCIRA